MSKFVRNEDAFTGLEAAIVLIAFVVVAAVFSYVVLGAGFFTTQKSQEVVHTGVSQASSNVEVSGPVVVKGAALNVIGDVEFYLQLAAGGSPVDMTKVTYTVSTGDAVVIYDVNDVALAWENRDADNNNLLEPFEFVLVTIGTVDALPTIGENVRFTVEVKPDVGASYPIQRNAPPSIIAGTYYEVY